MSNTQQLADKIIKLLEAEQSATNFASIKASIDEINERIDQLEAAFRNTQTEIIRNSYSNHPSKDRFAIAEAIADAAIDAKSKEKVCTFEPNGRPCDHCAMCSARGF